MVRPVMKKILILPAVFLLLCSCEHDIAEEARFNVTLSAENTYVAGEPVVFEFEGNIDNILFYSGELGSEYQHRDRYSVPVEDVRSATLQLEYQARYGKPEAMDVWVSTEFQGLAGDNAESDRKTISDMCKDMKGWKRIDYEEGASTEWTEQSYMLTDSLPGKQNFSLAFHWNPKEYRDTASGKYLTQRTYWINGKISFDIDEVIAMPIDLSELVFTTVMMNNEIEDPYLKNSGNGSIIMNSTSADLIFQGVPDKDSLDFAIDAWAISSPIDLNSVANDQGLVIKNQQNYLEEYSYTWNTPGTYVVTFVGSNDNYIGSTSEVREITVTILENI